MRHGLVVALLYGTAAAPCDPRNRSAGAAPPPRWLAVYYHKTGHDFSRALFGALLPPAGKPPRPPAGERGRRPSAWAWIRGVPRCGLSVAFACALLAPLLRGPFGRLLTALPLPERLRQFVPAYKATRIIAEVMHVHMHMGVGVGMDMDVDTGMDMDMDMHRSTT